MKRALVVWYSRSGYTASLVQELIAMTGWESLEIKDRHPREGGWGQFRCVWDVLLRRRPAILAEDKSLGGYETIVVAAPVWMRSLAAPMRSFICKHRGQFNALAHVCTYGGSGAEKAAQQAAALAGAPLVASLAVTSFELEQGDYRRRIDAFLKRLHEFRITP